MHVCTCARLVDAGSVLLRMCGVYTINTPTKAPRTLPVANLVLPRNCTTPLRVPAFTRHPSVRLALVFELGVDVEGVDCGVAERALEGVPRGVPGFFTTGELIRAWIFSTLCGGRKDPEVIQAGKQRKTQPQALV